MDKSIELAKIKLKEVDALESISIVLEKLKEEIISVKNEITNIKEETSQFKVGLKDITKRPVTLTKRDVNQTQMDKITKLIEKTIKIYDSSTESFMLAMELSNAIRSIFESDSENETLEIEYKYERVLKQIKDNL